MQKIQKFASKAEINTTCLYYLFVCRVIPSQEDGELSLTEQSNYYLELHKKQGAKGFYDDAYTFIFTENVDGIETLRKITPRHLTFECKTSNAEGESCDIRLYSVTSASEESKDDEDEDEGAVNGQSEETDQDDLQNEDGEASSRRQRQLQDDENLDETFLSQ